MSWKEVMLALVVVVHGHQEEGAVVSHMNAFESTRKQLYSIFSTQVNKRC